MSEDIAWSKFSSTGSIFDYLKYISIKKSKNKDIKEQN